MVLREALAGARVFVRIDFADVVARVVARVTARIHVVVVRCSLDEDLAPSTEQQVPVIQVLVGKRRRELGWLGKRARCGRGGRLFAHGHLHQTRSGMTREPTSA